MLLNYEGVSLCLGLDLFNREFRIVSHRSSHAFLFDERTVDSGVWVIKGILLGVLGSGFLSSLSAIEV